MTNDMIINLVRERKEESEEEEDEVCTEVIKMQQRSGNCN
jgi:hypothetical protein